METKIRKISYLLSENARITTKSIGKRIRISQQSASYTIGQVMEKKHLINYKTIVDSARFGYINIIVLYTVVGFEKVRVDRIRKVLLANPNITLVEEVAMGGDFMAQYTVPNLSFFNKQHRFTTAELGKDAKVVDMFVVNYRYGYLPKYLVPRPSYKYWIVSGDRDVTDLNQVQTRVLRSLLEDARIPITNVADQLKLDPKTVTSTKKWLEDKEFILGYTLDLNHKKLGLKRMYVLVEFEQSGREEAVRILEFAHRNKNVVGLTKIIGRYEFILTVEFEGEQSGVITALRQNFPVVRYEIIESLGILKNVYFPKEAL